MVKQPVEYGNGNALESLESAGRYLLCAAPEPWEILQTQISNQPAGVKLNEFMNEEHLEQLVQEQIASGTTVDYVVGLGGGTACDTAKYFAWKLGIPLITIPSIISVDAWYCSSIGVRRNYKVTYIGEVEPSRVIVDYDLIRKAPAFLNAAGVADTLSITTALGDWMLGRDDAGDPFNKIVFSHAQQIAEDLLKAEPAIVPYTDEGIKAIAGSHVEEVHLCEAWGNARPEEGAEHFLGYCLESQTHAHYLHGALIALNIVAVLKLQGEHAAFPWNRLARFFDAIGLLWRPGNQKIGREEYLAALQEVFDYVVRENHTYSIFNHLTREGYDPAKLLELVEWVYLL